MSGNPIIPPVLPVPRPRRGGLAVARRILALALIMLAAVGTASAQAGATIQVGSGPATYVASTDIATGQGFATTPTGQSLQGKSLDDLLAGADPATVTAVVINGSRFLPADIPPGAPLVAVGGSRTYVLLGASGGVPQYAASSSVAIHVFLKPAAPAAVPGAATLAVTANATPNPVSSHTQAVDFAALVTSAPPGSRLTYFWSFGDGSTALGAAVQHTYGADNTWPAYVTVTDGLNDPGVTATVSVIVGHPHRTARGSGLGTSTANGLGAGGTGTGKGGTGGAANPGGRGATQPKPSVKPAVKPVVRPGSAAKGARPPASANALQVVRGVLLADVGSPFDLRLSPPPPSGSPGAARRSPGGASGVGAVVGGLALALAIVALGGLKERRHGTLRRA